MQGAAKAQDSSVLRDIYARLGEADRATLLAFAEFLATRSGATAEAIDTVPKAIPRPAQESVVGAIKRLSASYHMLDRSKILHETSALMTQHMMQGRAADEVIDELEILFERHYTKQFGDKD